MSRNTYCPHCNIANYCRDQPWCPRRLQQMQCDDHEMFAGGLEKENAQLREIIAELLSLLKTVEWVETTEVLAHGGGNYESRCPWCDALGQNPPNWWKHEPNCPRQAAVARAKEAIQEEEQE